MNKHRFLLIINLILSSLSSLSASPLLSQAHQIYEHNYIYNSIDRHTYIDSLSQHNLSESTTNHRTSTPHKLLQNHNYDSSQNFHDKQANVMAFESSGASLQNWLSLVAPKSGPYDGINFPEGKFTDSTLEKFGDGVDFHLFKMDERLMVDMPRALPGQPQNSAGYLRDAQYYWKTLYQKHPAAFSQDNLKIINGLIKTKKGSVVTTVKNDAQFKVVSTRYT